MDRNVYLKNGTRTRNMTFKDVTGARLTEKFESS